MRELKSLLWKTKGYREGERERDSDVPPITRNVKWHIKGRSRRLVKINLIETDLKESFLPLINVCDDKIFLGEDFVKNE